MLRDKTMFQLVLKSSRTGPERGRERERAAAGEEEEVMGEQ